MGMNLCKLCEIVNDRGGWHATVQRVAHDLATKQPQKPSYPSKIRDILDIGLLLYPWENFRQRIQFIFKWIDLVLTSLVWSVRSIKLPDSSGSQINLKGPTHRPLRTREQQQKNQRRTEDISSIWAGRGGEGREGGQIQC